MNNGFDSCEADYELIDSDKECPQRYGYEELHITPESLEALQNGKDIVVYVQGENVLRITTGKAPEKEQIIHTVKYVWTE